MSVTSNPVTNMERKSIYSTIDIDTRGHVADVIAELEAAVVKLREHGVDPGICEVNILSGCDYCDGEADVEISFRRMETDAEHVRRIERQMKMEVDRTAREKVELKRLQDKYK